MGRSGKNSKNRSGKEEWNTAHSSEDDIQEDNMFMKAIEKHANLGAQGKLGRDDSLMKELESLATDKAPKENICMDTVWTRS